MQRLEVSGAVRPLYGSLGVKGLKYVNNVIIFAYIYIYIYIHRIDNSVVVQVY